MYLKTTTIEFVWLYESFIVKIGFKEIFVVVLRM